MVANKTFSEYIGELSNCGKTSGVALGEELTKLYEGWKHDAVKNIDAYIELSEKILKEQEIINNVMGMKDIVKKMRGELFEELVWDILNAGISSL